MSQVHDIIQELRLNSSLLKKQDILEQNKENTLLKKVFFLTENPLINFYIKVDKKELLGIPSGSAILSEDMLRKVQVNLAERGVTGSDAREYLNGLLAALNSKDREVLAAIINRDLECNTGTSLCNKVWKDLIPEMPCMLASKMDEKAAKSIVPKKDGYLVQAKKDGGRMMLAVDADGNVKALSRNGKELVLHGFFDTAFSGFKNCVFDGELVVQSGNGVMDRKTGNGYFTKAVRGTIKKSEASQFHYVMWDVVPFDDFYSGKCSAPYSDRLRQLTEMVGGMNPNIVSIVETKVISSLEEAQTFYESMLARGEEGAILKFADMPWEDRRSKKMIKLKEEKDIDAEVIGITEHKKVAGWIGALTCKTSDGEVVFDVGSGFTEADRQLPWDTFLGKIVQCKYNAVITAKNRTEKSLFLPIFVQVRHDKLTANSADELK